MKSNILIFVLLMTLGIISCDNPVEENETSATFEEAVWLMLDKSSSVYIDSSLAFSIQEKLKLARTADSHLSEITINSTFELNTIVLGKSFDPDSIYDDSSCTYGNETVDSILVNYGLNECELIINFTTVTYILKSEIDLNILALRNTLRDTGLVELISLLHIDTGPLIFTNITLKIVEEAFFFTFSDIDDENELVEWEVRVVGNSVELLSKG